MCGRYQFSADEYKEIRQIVRDAQRRSEGNELNFPMAGDICPSQVAPVLVSRGEKIVGEFQQWGLPGFRGRQQIINARAETVTEKPMFRRSIAFQRCVIKNNPTCLRHPSRKYVSIRMTLILSIIPLSKIMWSACLNRSISTLGQMDLGKAERFISETRMALSLK